MRYVTSKFWTYVLRDWKTFFRPLNNIWIILYSQDANFVTDIIIRNLNPASITEQTSELKHQNNLMFPRSNNGFPGTDNLDPLPVGGLFHSSKVPYYYEALFDLAGIIRRLRKQEATQRLRGRRPAMDQRFRILVIK